MKKEDFFGEAVAQKVALLAISPIDGRYDSIGEKLNDYFSEYALIESRVFVEIAWLDFIISNVDNIPALKDVTITNDDLVKMWNIYNNFSLDDAVKIKEIEQFTKHDVKAVEYFIANELANNDLVCLISLVHIGCTSEDINNTAYGLLLSESLKNVWIPAAEEFIAKIAELSRNFNDVVMLGHTHGQRATPTTVGKEFAVYVTRLQGVLKTIKNIKIKGKFNGATGCYSAITTVFPEEDWPILCREFVTDVLRLEFNAVTTQIEPHDYMVELFDAIRHFNNIIIDMDVDMWLYISMDYFKQIPVAGEVGSSVMPHKINPIWFENSEANADMSNAIFTTLSNKLTRSRMQRDLSDSSSQRYIGMAFSCSLLSISNALRGLKKTDVNIDVIDNDLEESWEVLAEPIQTMLRKYGIPDAYDQLKELTRGKSITDEDIHQFISSLNVLSEQDKETLMNLTPSSYVGRIANLI